MDEPLPPLRERLRALKLVPPFLRLVWETEPRYAAAVVVLRILQGFGPVTLFWVSKLIFDVLQEVLAGRASIADAWPRLLALIGLELGVALLLEVLQRATSLVESLLADLFGNRLSVRLMRHAAALDLEHFEDPDFYDHLERARRQTVGRIALLTLLLGTAQSLLTIGTLLGALLGFSPWLLALLGVAVLPAFLGETHFAGLAYSLLYRWTPERRQLDYLRYVASSDVTAKEVKLFGLADHLVERYAELADRFYEANRALALRRSAVGAGLAAVSTGAFYGAFGFLAWRTLVGAISLGDLTFAANSFRRTRDLMATVLGNAASIYEQSLFLGDLFTFLDMKPRVVARNGGRPVPAVIREGFRFEGVGFRYPDAERWALRDATFTLGPGERIALVGENGAGKTTLVKLLARLYDPSEGRILLDGIDLREYDVESLRRAIGVIFQDYVRYDMPVRENIAVGDIVRIEDAAGIESAAYKSLAAPVIARLERGYEHMLGRRFEGGANLSGGEWQKVALARAYLRDAQVLILDEPTAALDARAEYEVFRRFAELTEGRMAVLISHRFSTVRMADRILVLEGGRIVEDGSHDALVAAGGRYAELFTLQAAGYR
ncbi:MAG: ABC transporter ATP-binding protein [Gemmatimonadota bacterium]